MGIIDNPNKQKIKSLIPDENLRNLIFNFEDKRSYFLTDQKQFIKYFNNALLITFFLVYKQFISFKKRILDENFNSNLTIFNDFSNSFIRLYNLFDSCYTSKVISIEIIENIILNLQIDYSINEEKSFLKVLHINKMFNLPTSENNLSQYLFVLKKSRLSSKDIPKFTFENLCDFFKMIPFIKDARVFFHNFSNYKSLNIQTIEFAFDNDSLAPIFLDELVLLINKNSFYYLDNFTFDDPRSSTKDNPNKTQAIKGTYIQFSLGPVEKKLLIVNSLDFIEDKLDGLDIIVNHETAIEDFLFRFMIFNIIGMKGESYFFKDYIFFNNKYIKYLALIISDLIDGRSKNDLYIAYKDKYRNFFEKICQGSNFSDKGYLLKWDDIIIFLLLEEGIYSFLKYLLKETNIQYENIIYELKIRFGNKVNSIIEKNEAIRNPLINAQTKNKDNRIKCFARSLILLASKLFSINNYDLANDYSPIAINDLITELNEVKNSKRIKTNEKIAYFINKVININLFVVIFYRGLLKYVDVKKFEEMKEFETLLLNNSNDHRHTQNMYNSAFSMETKRIKRELYDKCQFGKLLQLQMNDPEYFSRIKYFVELSFDLMNELNDEVRKRNSVKNEQLFDAIGKRKIFEKEDMEKCSNAILLKIQECIFHSSNIENVEKILFENIIFYLEYLRDGSFLKGDSIENAIYPIVGSYSNSVVSRDGYRYSYMNVNHGENGNQISIKMIIEEDFNFGISYYCVPNINRVACLPRFNQEEERIWVSPIIIPYDAYAPIISAKVERLQNKNDYSAVAEILFDTDQKIYSGLFGNVEIAKKVLPILFERKTLNKQSVFYKDYIYCLKITNKDNEEQIVAVASFYTSLPEWSIDLIESAFIEADIDLPKSIESANAYFEDTFNNSFGDSYVICDLCVHKDFRNKGYAKYLLNKLIKLAELNGEKNIILSVYEDNLIAFNLYNSLGFVPYGSDYDTRGAEKTNREKYIKMIKYT